MHVEDGVAEVEPLLEEPVFSEENILEDKEMDFVEDFTSEQKIVQKSVNVFEAVEAELDQKE